MNRHYFIYKIINPLGQIYIGKTINIKKRIIKHKSRSQNPCSKISKSIIEHGFDNHTINIIDEFDSNDIYANGKEMFWIRSNMSNVNKWPEMMGLNSTDGGKGAKCHIASHAGKKRESWIGKRISISKMKKVTKFSLDGEFIKEYKSQIDAAKENNVSKQAISKCVRGRSSQCKGSIYKVI